RGGVPDHVEPDHARGARVGAQERRQDADERRLAGAVWPEQAEHGPAAHVEIDALERLNVAVGLRQAPNGNGQSVGTHAPDSTGRQPLGPPSEPTPRTAQANQPHTYLRSCHGAKRGRCRGGDDRRAGSKRYVRRDRQWQTWWSRTPSVKRAPSFTTPVT